MIREFLRHSPSGIGQRNFIQSLGSIGPTGGFKRIRCLGIFCWRKNGAGLFLGLGSLSKSRAGGFYSHIFAEKHHRCIPKAC